jgi:hypothetical protein
MPRGRIGTGKVIAPGTNFGPWEVIREVERHKYNRRFECRCTGCGTVKVRWLSNLEQGKVGCLICTPLSTLNRPGLQAIVAERRARAQFTDEGRICHTCGAWKPWKCFGRDLRKENGKASNCFECNNWRTVRLYFGITKDEYFWLHTRQSGVCALCGQPEEERSARLSIDHDHSCCGKDRACKKCIRGLLCNCCNRMLGYVEKREANRLRFTDYLAQRPFMSVAGDAEPVLKDVVDSLAEDAA